MLRFVKIFKHRTSRDLQQSINSWVLAEKVNIISVQLSFDRNTLKENYIATVLYEEAK